MEPTLEVGDTISVDASAHCCKRGDIIVFRSGANREWHTAGLDALVKRVVATGGQTISQCNGAHVCIDGRQLRERYVPRGTPTIFPSTLPKLPDGALGCAPSSPAGACTVPRGTLFVMGDNRMNSQDSRANGPITIRSVVGVVEQ